MERLYILWIDADEMVFDKMIAMYAKNSKIKGWWEGVTIIIWGPTAKLAVESDFVRSKIKELIDCGVDVSACKACSDALEATGRLIEIGVEVKYWGEGLTNILKSGARLLTI